MTALDYDERLPKEPPADGEAQYTGSAEAVSTSPESAGVSEGVESRPLDCRFVGYFEWIRAVRDTPTDFLPGRVKGTILLLATWGDVKGREIRPGMKRLGRAVGKSDDNVGRELKIAVDAGFLHRWRPNRHKVYRYRLTLPLDRPAGIGDPLESAGLEPLESTGYLHNDLPIEGSPPGFPRTDHEDQLDDAVARGAHADVEEDF